jgi:N-acetylglucosaminyldiphosphoundecaprenol N-acetyl-beta-D-mannosaminyltransferase
VDATNIDEVIAAVDDKIVAGGKGYITVTGVHGIMESVRSPRVLEAHRKAWRVVPDGMPLVHIGRLIHRQRSMRRCFGPELMEKLLAHSVSKSYTHFLFGGNEGVAQSLKAKLEERFPGLRVVGTYTPPFRPLNAQERTELVRRVDQLKPDFFWVGLSTPKQEIFMHEYLPLLSTHIMLGVGAAFDYLNGHLTRAPRWMQLLALEWLYRLLLEPRRLWKRYLVNNPLFLFHFSLQLCGLKKYGESSDRPS